MRAKPPAERIYGWLDSQLSIARHYGACMYNGHRYLIAYDEDRQPLVREDVLKREVKARQAEKRRLKRESAHDGEREQRDAFTRQEKTNGEYPG